MDEVWFVDADGRSICNEDISSHIGLATQLLSEDEELRKEYEEGKEKNVIDFFIKEKGYLKVANIGEYYKVVVFFSPKLSEKQKSEIYRYLVQGYKLEDLARKDRDLAEER